MACALVLAFGVGTIVRGADTPDPQLAQGATTKAPDPKPAEG